MILQGGNPDFPIRHEGILAALLLTIALLDMPYGYYQLLRWVIMFIGFSIAFDKAAQQRKWMLYFGLSVAALFNPFFKISFDRDTWWLIDLTLAGVFLFIGLTVRNETKPERQDDWIDTSLDDFMKRDHQSDQDN